jgi:hypothetical protein
MAKTITGKRVVFSVELYWRGKRKLPSIGMWVGDDEVSGDFGLPTEYPEFKDFEKAARNLCRALTDAGELD